MSSSVRRTGLAAMHYARQATLGLLEDFPEDKWCFQPVPNGNHALWLLGHVALTDDFFLHALSGRARKAPEGWEKLFWMGSQPVGDPKRYPDVNVVKRELTDRRGDLLTWFHDQEEEQLEANPPRPLQPFAQSIGGLMASIAWHEGFHMGQLSVVRKALGLKPRFA